MLARALVAIAGVAVMALGVVDFFTVPDSQDGGLSGLTYLFAMVQVGIGGLVAIVGIVALIRWRRGRQRRGTTLQTAMRIAADQIAEAVESQRCLECRGAVVAAGPEDHIRFDEREIRLLRLSCTRCGTIRPLYVDREPQLPKARLRAP